ncbi:MAG: universal stress protein [Pseudomonadota bacterium]
MAYKTILVHVDQSRHMAQRVKLAAMIARAEKAHLIGAAMTGISRFVYGNDGVPPQDPTLAAHLEFLRQRADHALAEFEAIAKLAGLDSLEKRVADDEAGSGINLLARYCDLVVIGQTDPDEPTPGVTPNFPEHVVLHCGRPVLIVPYTGHVDQVGSKVLLAWDASMEATRAVAGALPLFKRATGVEIVIFNAHASLLLPNAEPGTDIQAYLARHGIKTVLTLQKTDLDVGTALLSLASDRTSDLIVMGAYGHSRFREILLGGVTRVVLQSMTLPVLMAH